MARITNSFFTPYDMLMSFLSKTGFRFHHRMDKKLYPYEHALSVATHHQRRHCTTHQLQGTQSSKKRDTIYRRILFGGLHQAALIKKDMRDFGKNYKSKHQIKRDLALPLNALLLTLRGALSLLVAFGAFVSVYLIFETLGLVANLIKGNKQELAHHKMHYQLGVSRFIAQCVDALLSIIRGVVLMLITPVNYFIKMPIRYTLSEKSNGKILFNSVEHNKGIQKQLNILSQTYQKYQSEMMPYFNREREWTDKDSLLLTKLSLVCQMTHYKIKKASKKGQPLGKFKDIDQQDCNQPDDYASWVLKTK